MNPEGKQYFSRDRFAYDAETDSWRCPAGATLTRRKLSHTQHKKEYWTDTCEGCALAEMARKLAYVPRTDCTRAERAQ